MAALSVKKFHPFLCKCLLLLLICSGLFWHRSAEKKEPLSTAEKKVVTSVDMAPPPRTAPPPPLTEYKGRRIASVMPHHGGGSWLLRRVREQEENTECLISELRLRPGLTVCDLGSGNGYHTLKMARLVGPTGKVIAVDIQPEMLAELRARAALENITNIQTIEGDVHDPRLSPQSCDLILLVDVYHEFSHPEQMLRAMHAALKPNGLIALVEYKAEDPTIPIKPDHKMSKAQIRLEWEPMGFSITREFDGLPWQHLIFFRRNKTDSP